MTTLAPTYNAGAIEWVAKTPADGFALCELYTRMVADRCAAEVTAVGAELRLRVVVRLATPTPSIVKQVISDHVREVDELRLKNQVEYFDRKIRLAQAMKPEIAMGEFPV